MLGKKEHRRSALGLILDAIVLLITVVCSVLLLAAYFSKSINPNNISIFSVIGLIAPMLYIAEIVLCLYWIIRWKVYSLFALLILIAGANNISLFYRPNLEKEYTQEQGNRNNQLRVMSYNACGFIDQTTKENKLGEMLDFITEQDPDILCIQEFQVTPINTKQRIENRLGDLTYNRIKYSQANSDQESGWGLAVYSKYPIINSLHLEYEGSSNSSMWADVKINKDTIRVFNIHLQSTQVNSNDQEFITSTTQLQDDPENTKVRLKEIASKLRENSKIRANQADSLAIHLARNPHPVIVCGDFNDTPMSYSYTRLRSDLNDAFTERGQGVTSTYKGFFNLFRIDYILHSSELTALNYANPNSDLSDHNPVIVTFEKPGN